VADRSALSSSNVLERSPESVLHGQGGCMPAETDVSFDNQGFPAPGFGCRHPKTSLSCSPELTNGYTRASTFLTDAAYQWPPRGVETPRAA
jgi:hypothetical protein